MDDDIKNGYETNFSYTIQNGPVNPTLTNMSIVPQISTRPNTLQINGHRDNNSSLFTPDDYQKFSMSTPDLINALATQPYNDGQPSPNVKMLEEMFTTHATNNNYNHAFDRNTNQTVSITDNRMQENVPAYRIVRKTSPVSLRDRSISSSMNDNESSTSTEASSPTAPYLHLNRVKDELQHVPSVQMSSPGEPHELVRKEKKRERNRQAAQKCRTRKLTRIAELQKRVNDLQGKNKNLTGIAEFLKSDITKLEQQLQDHHTQGCTLRNGSLL